ncbi:MAG: hypothetical protein ACOYLB_17000 [Phototrophicaceae bacterium]
MNDFEREQKAQLLQKQEALRQKLTEARELAQRVNLVLDASEIIKTTEFKALQLVTDEIERVKTNHE